jgi:hypothetical protein
MNGILYPIIIAIVWAIIQAVATARAKKQREERLRQQAQMRQTAAESMSTSATTTGQPASMVRPPVSQSQVPVAASSRLDELAARRKAQLDQLRRRQQQQQRGGPGAGRVQVGAAAPTRPMASQKPRTVASARPEPHRIEEMQASREGVQADRDQARKRREAEHDAQVQAVRETAAREDAEARAVASRRKAAAKARSVAEKAEADLALAGAQAGTRLSAERVRDAVARHPASADRFRQLLRNPASVREVMILREVLDSPVSSRA